MTQTTPRPVRTASGMMTHWTLDGQTTICGKVPTDLLPHIEAEILEGRRDVKCRTCDRRTAWVRRALAR